jgi:hypothetical protein
MLPRELVSKNKFTADNPGGAEAKQPQDKGSCDRYQDNPGNSSNTCINGSTRIG